MKNYLLPIIVISCFLLSISVVGQQPTPSKGEDVVKISTNLIQIDATVTDKKGNIVNDLTINDFEIYENGEKQNISNFSFIKIQPETLADGSFAFDENAKGTPPLPNTPNNLRPDQVRRTIALVVDDLGLSFTNVKFVRDALKKFVREQMKPGDLVAIIRTGSGVGALQQFTSDKQMLFAAIERIKFNLNGRVGISSFEPIRPTFKKDVNAVSIGLAEDLGDVTGTAEDSQFDLGLNQFREDGFAVGTLGALNYVVRGIGSLPGRKAVMIFSEGFNITTVENNQVRMSNPRIFDALRTVTDLANRSSVIIYAVDPRGLVVPGASAEDEFVGLRASISEVTDSLKNREDNFRNSQQGLQFLTEETGGFAFINQNSINRGIEKMLNDQNGYYLIGYQPDGEVFDAKKRSFNKLEVRLKRPGLNIRYRSGFFGKTASEIDPSLLSTDQQVLSALTSPFTKNDIELKMTAFYLEKPKIGSAMETVIHLNAKDLKFIKEPDNRYSVSFEILSVIFGDNGIVMDMLNRTETIKMKEADFQEIQQRGLVYSIAVPIKKPGAYQMRFVLRDQNTLKLGSATQYIEVPNLKKKQLTLSGIALQNVKQTQQQTLQSDEQRDVALRQFNRGATLQFIFDIYNAKTDSNLKTSFRLFRENKLLFTSNEAPVSNDQTTSAKGSFTLNDKMPFGNYVLQVIVENPSESGKNKFKVQWIDFEVVQ